MLNWILRLLSLTMNGDTNSPGFVDGDAPADDDIIIKGG